MMNANTNQTNQGTHSTPKPSSDDFLAKVDKIAANIHAEHHTEDETLLKYRTYF